MRKTKDEQRIELAEWLANLVGTAPVLINGFYNNLPQQDLLTVQGDFFYRAYEVIKQVESGDNNADTIIQYMYGNDILKKYPGVVEAAIEEIKPSIYNIVSVVSHQMKYADSPIMVPPIIEQQLLLGPEFVKKRCMDYLRKREIDPEEYIEMLKKRIGSEENPDPRDPMFLNKMFDDKKMDQVSREVMRDMQNMRKMGR